ncbi:MAG: AraC family transcriptional regulator [bacterium]
MKTFLIVLFICFYPFVNYAQNNSIDSLKNLFASTKEDSTKVKILIKISAKYMSTEPDKALNYAHQAAELAKKAKFKFGEAEALYQIAYYYYQRSDLKEALEKFITVEKFCEKNKIENYLLKAINNIAVINARSGNIKLALEYFIKLLKRTENTSKTSEWVLAVLNIGNCYHEMGDTNKAIEKFSESYLLAKKYNFIYGINISLNNLSCLYYEQKNYTEAKKYSAESFRIANEKQDVELILESSVNLADILNKLGDKNKALYYVLEGIKIAEKINAKKQLKTLYKNAAVYYSEMGDFKYAFEYQNKYQTIKDTIFNEANAKAIADLQTKYNIENKEKDLQIKDLEIKDKNFQLVAESIIFGLVLTTLIIVLLLYRKRNLAYIDLVNKNLELMATEDRLKLMEQEDVKENIELRIIQMKGGVKNHLKYKNSTLNDDTRNRIMIDLTNLMEREKSFLDKDLSVEKLANLLNLNGKYLSQIINENFGENFPNFINELRIKEARRLLISPEHAHLSLEAIGEIVGFHSKPSFNNAFKKFTGITPSFYKNTASKTGQVA